MSAKRRYDAKRRSDPERKKKEACRSKLRRMGFVKSGVCPLCGSYGHTVWHHYSYHDAAVVVELCYRCHRACHPRTLPNGKVI